jgi:hypothetical protein
VRRTTDSSRKEDRIEGDFLRKYDRKGMIHAGKKVGIGENHPEKLSG